MSVFNINFPNDGTYFKEYESIGLWYSNQRIYGPVPRVWLFDANGIAFLSYVTEAEWNSVVSHFAGYPDYSLKSGPAEIDFFGPPVRINSSVPKGQVALAPIYFRTNTIDLHKVVYLTQKQIDYIKEQNPAVATSNAKGPYKIPMFWDYPGDTPTTTGPISGAAWNGTSVVTSPDSGVWKDAAGNPIRTGNPPGGTGGGDSSGYKPNNRYYPVYFGPNSGVYTGSLSAQGNMVAMQLNPGQPNLVGDGTDNAFVKPYHSGYFKEYWRNPETTTFGANTPMPALTGVMPDTYPDMPGNAVYYTDLQMYRLSGSNQWDNNYFLNSFNQALTWTLISNNYLVALKTAQNTNLAYYGADSYQALTTQGFSKYQTGQALLLAFRNIGKVASSITSGYFGTANAVAQVLIDYGLGYINNLAVTLYSGGVNFDDIGNEVYTPFITEQLRQITNATDLQTIQEVLESNVPNIANPLDYTRIDRSAGIPNDSEFASFAAVGQDFYNRAPNLTLKTGSEIADLIDSIQSNVTANVETIANTSLIDQNIIDTVRAYLPVSRDNQPISVLNVVGMASGYLLEDMQKVNEGIAALYATDYGPQIRSTLTNISRYDAQVPLTTSEQGQSDGWWNTQLENEKNSYYALIDTIVADTSGNIPAIVNQINTHYDNFTSNLYYEYTNYGRANITTSNFNDVTSTLSFIQSLPSYGADPDNIGTDLLLYGITQSNQGGETARTILDQGKYDFFLTNVGVTITGII